MRWAIVCVSVLCAVACTPSEEYLCDLKCECEGCSDSEYDHCLNGYDDELDRADRADCLDEWDDVLACREDTGYCAADKKGGDKFKDDCGPEDSRWHACVD